jgi:hypothetical protein
MKRFLLIAIAALVCCEAQAPNNFRNPNFIGLVAASAGTVGGGGGGYTPTAGTFDTADNYLLRSSGLSGPADGTQGLFNIWLKRADTGRQQNLLMILGISEHLDCFINASDEIQIDGYNTSGSLIMRLKSTATITDTTSWHHLVVSWDLSDLAKHWMYLDDADVTTHTVYNTAETIDYTGTGCAYGNRGDPFGRFNGCLLDGALAVGAGTLVDLSVSGNRRLFDSISPLKPVDLTGAASWVVWIKALDGSNAGSGGSFTLSGSIPSCTGP